MFLSEASSLRRLRSPSPKSSPCHRKSPLIKSGMIYGWSDRPVNLKSGTPCIIRHSTVSPSCLVVMLTHRIEPPFMSTTPLELSPSTSLPISSSLRPRSAICASTPMPCRTLQTLSLVLSLKLSFTLSKKPTVTPCNIGFDQ